jgi:hypothetical protein
MVQEGLRQQKRAQTTRLASFGPPEFGMYFFRVFIHLLIAFRSIWYDS